MLYTKEIAQEEILSGEVLSLEDPVLEFMASIRELEPRDYHQGYLELCAELTTCEELSEAQFHQILAEREAAHWHTWVLEDSGRVIATISLHLERKFYRGGHYVGHIEDVIVHSNYQKHKLGKALTQFAIEKAQSMACYKVILDCDENLEGFYQKSGLECSNIQMARYFA